LTARPAGDVPGSRDGRRRHWTLLATSVGFAVVQLDVSVVNVAIKPIGDQLGTRLDALQWVINAYTVAFAALILSAGALADRFGARRLFVGGFAVFTAASAACALAPSLAVLTTARVAQGVGAAVLVPCSLTLLHHTFRDPAARARAVGLWAAGASVALSAGPLVGGLLTASLGWRSIFFINVPLGCLGIAVTWRHARETPRCGGRGIDLPGQGLAVMALLALAWATITAGEHGLSAPVRGGYVAAAAATALFVLIESRSSAPMLPLHLFRSATFSAATTIGLLVNIAFYGLVFVFSLYFQTTLGFSALATGAAFAPMTAAVLAGNLLAGRLSRRILARRTIMVGAAIMAAGLAGLWAITAGSSYGSLVAQLIALGFGLGLLVPAMTTELLGSVEASRSGVASGTLNTARQTGSVIGVALFGALAATSLITGLRRDLIIAVVAALLAAALTAVMDREPGRRG
jgi:DHA2 family methylenomycin A resistance protein-like MFS transporter